MTCVLSFIVLCIVLFSSHQSENNTVPPVNRSLLHNLGYRCLIISINEICHYMEYLKIDSVSWPTQCILGKHSTYTTYKVWTESYESDTHRVQTTMLLLRSRKKSFWKRRYTLNCRKKIWLIANYVTTASIMDNRCMRTWLNFSYRTMPGYRTLWLLLRVWSNLTSVRIEVRNSVLPNLVSPSAHPLRIHDSLN